MSQFIFGLLAGIVVGLVMEWVIDWAGLLPNRSTMKSQKRNATQRATNTQSRQTIATEAVTTADSPPAQHDNGA